MFDLFLSIALLHALFAVALFTGFIVAGSVSVLRPPTSARATAPVTARKVAAARVAAQPIDFDRVAA